MSIIENELGGVPVSLDQLIALNDELIALVRSGVPLERGLIQASGDLRGRQSEIARSVAERMSAGDRLPEALANSGYSMPAIYRSILEAGLRSGRLSAALEGMARLARGYADARRAVGLALVYPLIVLILAYGFSVVFLVQVAPRLAWSYQSLGLSSSGLITFLERAGETVRYWGPILPVLLVLLLLRWMTSGRSISLDAGAFEVGTSRLPWIGPMIAGFRQASFAETLALLIDHQVPIDQAIGLAARASGGRALRKTSDSLAERLRTGDGVEPPSTGAHKGMPPLLSWMLTAGHRQADLAPALRHAASTYRRKALARSDFLRAALPTVLTLAIGAGSVILYSLLLFVPMIRLYEALTIPNH